MPQPVLGATLIFALGFMVVAGMQIIMSRMMDGRKTFVVGTSLIFGLSVDIVPEVYRMAPDWLSPAVSSSLSAATIMAIVLNLIFRLGITKKAETTIGIEGNFTDNVFDFMEKQGGLWGARKEVMQRASFAVCEALESVEAINCKMVPVDMSVSFDEYSIDITLGYVGIPLSSTSKCPSLEDLDEENSGIYLSMFLIRKYCDSFKISSKDDKKNILKLHFIH